MVCEITEYNNVSCNGGDDGQFTVTAKGGVGEYEFSIDGGRSYQELGEFANLGASEYTVTVKDGNDNESTCTVTISEHDKLVVSIDGDVEDVSCNGDADGSISISVSGGTERYTIVWTKDGELYCS